MTTVDPGGSHRRPSSHLQLSPDHKRQLQGGRAALLADSEGNDKPDEAEDSACHSSNRCFSQAAPDVRPAIEASWSVGERTANGRAVVRG